MSGKTKSLTQDQITQALRNSDAAEKIIQLMQQEGINADSLRFGERKLPLLNELLVDINRSSLYGFVARKNISVCLALLEAGVNPQKIQRDKYCPLSLACENVRMDVIELEPVIHALLQAGAKPALCKKPHLLFVCGLISECQESGYLASPIHGYKEQGTDPGQDHERLSHTLA